MQPERRTPAARVVVNNRREMGAWTGGFQSCHSSAGAWIGIDLGTYNSVATVSLGGVPRPAALPRRTDRPGSVLPVLRRVRHRKGTCNGWASMPAGLPHVNPELVVWGVKRLIGKSYEEVKKSGDLDRFQYQVRKGRDGSCRIIAGVQEGVQPYRGLELRATEDQSRTPRPISIRSTPLSPKRTLTVPGVLQPISTSGDRASGPGWQGSTRFT